MRPRLRHRDSSSSHRRILPMVVAAKTVSSFARHDRFERAFFAWFSGGGLRHWATLGYRSGHKPPPGVTSETLIVPVWRSRAAGLWAAEDAPVSAPPGLIVRGRRSKPSA